MAFEPPATGAATDDFDLVVVGAGPAGASAAARAADRGLSVALIDKARFPRDKLCGGCVSGRAARHLAQVFGPLPPDLFHPVARVRLAYRGRSLGPEVTGPVLNMTMRHDFDAALVARAAQRGARVFAGQRIVAFDRDTGAFTLAGGQCLTGRLVVGADGVNSAVARALFGRSHDPARIGFGLELEAPADPGCESVEIDVGAAEWGYGWVFPKRRSLTVGVFGLAGRNPDLKASLAAYMARHGIAPEGLKIKGHHIPFGDFPGVPGRGRVLLAGDAAGLVDPITGEGIAWAIRSGMLAADAAAKALADGAPDTALAHYGTALGPVHAELTRARRLRGLLFAAPLRGPFVRMLGRNPALQQRYLGLLAGEIDYADIGTASLWRVARRLVGLGRA